MFHVKGFYAIKLKLSLMIHLKLFLLSNKKHEKESNNYHAIPKGNISLKKDGKSQIIAEKAKLHFSEDEFPKVIKLISLFFCLVNLFSCMFFFVIF